MSELVQRLAKGSHKLVYSRAKSVEDLKDAIDRGYVLLKFTETRGGTELGVPLDAAKCDWAQANFAAGQGRIHLEGQLELDYVPVRMIADLDLATLSGEGHLRVLGDAAS